MFRRILGYLRYGIACLYHIGYCTHKKSWQASHSRIESNRACNLTCTMLATGPSPVLVQMNGTEHQYFNRNMCLTRSAKVSCRNPERPCCLCVLSFVQHTCIYTYSGELHVHGFDTFNIWLSVCNLVFSFCCPPPVWKKTICMLLRLSFLRQLLFAYGVLPTTVTPSDQNSER